MNSGGVGSRQSVYCSVFSGRKSNTTRNMSGSNTLMIPIGTSTFFFVLVSPVASSWQAALFARSLRTLSRTNLCLVLRKWGHTILQNGGTALGRSGVQPMLVLQETPSLGYGPVSGEIFGTRLVATQIP